MPLCKGSKCQARAEGAEFGRWPPAHLCSPVDMQVGFRHPKDYVSYVWARSDDGERFVEKQLCAQVSVSRSHGQPCKMLGVCVPYGKAPAPTSVASLITRKALLPHCVGIRALSWVWRWWGTPPCPAPVPISFPWPAGAVLRGGAAQGERRVHPRVLQQHLQQHRRGDGALPGEQG